MKSGLGIGVSLAANLIFSVSLISVSLLSVFLLSVSLLSGCASAPKRVEAGAEAPPTEPKERLELTEVQKDLVRGAKRLEGAGRLNVKGREFRKDCTGAVAALYWYAGIDILSPLAHYRGNGVLRLYRFLKDEGLLVPSSSPSSESSESAKNSSGGPAPGDIIFWDNTYDKNEDGQVNDTLTHTGVVVSRDGDGTVVYYHHHYREGIVLERMDIEEPNVHTRNVDGETVVVNSPMRMRGSPNFDYWLAAQLVRTYGRAWKLEKITR